MSLESPQFEGPKEEQISDEAEVVEEVVDAQESEEAPASEISEEKVAQKEKSFLERFQGKAKKVAQAFALTSTLLAGNAASAEALEQTAVTRESAEDNIDESKLTDASSWSREMLADAKTSLAQVKTAEDAEWVAKDLLAIATEFRIPTKGTLVAGAYGLSTRNYTNDDLKFINKNVKEARAVLVNLNSQFKLAAFENRLNQFDTLITTLDNQTSLAGSRRRELINKYTN